MTAVTANPITRPAERSDESRPLRRLRLVLATNAANSFVGGIIGLAAAPWLSEELGIDHVTLTRIVSIGLIVFAIDVAVLARSRAERTIQWAASVSLADFAWVAATIVLVGTGTLTTAGVIVALAIGIAVLDFGILQLWFRSRART